MLVTVIIPAYNAEQYISETLDSILNQTYKNLEILCINDGSTDNTENIIKNYMQRDKRIKLHSQENKGLPASRNVGMNLATGDMITFIDADDTCSPNTIESSINLLKENNFDIVINYLDYRITVKNKPIGKFSYLCTWQVLFKKELLKKNPHIYCDEDLTQGEDVVFTHKLLTSTNKIGKNSASQIYYRQHEGQMTDIDSDREMISHTYKCLSYIIKFYDENNLWDKNKTLFKYYLIEHPFTQYLKRNWAIKEREKIFNYLHEIINNKNISTKLCGFNLRELAFYIFTHTHNFILFEFIRYFAYIYYKNLDRKKYLNHLRIYNNNKHLTI